MAAEILTKMDELKALIIYNLDIEEFLDILGMDLSDLVEHFEDEIQENFVELMSACT